MSTTSYFFAPQLFIESGITDISFYEKAFDAVELRRWTNDDGSIHVAELSIGGAMFHLHEEKLSAGNFSPHYTRGTTALVGLFVSDVDTVINNAIEAGATLVSPAQSYDYEYRQGQVKDPFGHVKLLQSARLYICSAIIVIIRFKSGETFDGLDLNDFRRF